MVSIPANVLNLFKRPDTVKVLVTASADGQPRAVVCGSIFPIDDGTLGVGQVLMRTSMRNIAENGKAALLVVSGVESYLVNAEYAETLSSGPVLDGLNAKLEAVHLHAHAVVTFRATAVFNEGVGPDAGRRIARGPPAFIGAPRCQAHVRQIHGVGRGRAGGRHGRRPCGPAADRDGRPAGRPGHVRRSRGRGGQPGRPEAVHDGARAR